MPFTVFLAVLFSAALHAGWNALVKIRLDPFPAMTLICCVCGAIALPIVFVTGAPRPSAWPWIFASIVVHLGYYLSLAQAYRLADMMQAYPVARGAAPLMTAGASLLAVGDPISAGALAGIAVLAAGVLLVALAGHRRFAPPSRLAIVCALLTAATISAYTIIDGVGAREAGDPNAYAASLFALDAYPMLLVCFWRQGVAGMKAMLGFLTPGLVGGAMSLAAYWIVIWAMTRAPIALVAAVRESSVLFGGLIALFVLKEPATPIRIMAAALILAGLAIMRLA